METDINIPKTKSVNIFFQYARMLFYLSVISNVLPTLTTSEVCSSEGIKLNNLNFKGSVALILLNGVSLLFIWLKEPFARLEFFVMYAVNICWSGIIMAQTYIDIMYQPNECEGMILAEKLILFFHAKVHIEIFLTFMSPPTFLFRIVNLPTTLYPLYLLMTALQPQTTCSRDLPNILFGMIFINLLLFGFGIPINFALLCSRKPTVPNMFRFLLMLGIIAQGGIMALIYQAEVMNTNECLPTALIFRTYLYICPVALLCSITLMMSLPSFDHQEIRFQLLQQRLQSPMVVDEFQQKKAQPVQDEPLQKSRSVINDGKSMYGTVIRK